MLRSRSSSPSSRCYQRGTQTGCYTTGWQDHVELSDHVRYYQRRDPQRFVPRLQRIFKAHARALPSFLSKGHAHGTWEENGGELFLMTECTTGAPEWHPQRNPGPGCHLFTLLGYV